MSIIRRGAAVAAVAAVTLGVAVGIAGPASAEGSQDCTGHTTGLCLYYNSNEHGARIDALGDVWNYAVNPNSPACNGAAGCPPYLFSYYGYNGSNGYGQHVKNNAASACSDNGADSYNVYYNSGYLGSADSIGFGQAYCINLYNTYNNNASQQRI